MARPIYVPQAGRVIEFSDDATDDQIQAYVQTNYMKPAPAPSPVQPQTERSLSGALSSGVSSLLGSAEVASGGVAEGIESLTGAKPEWSNYFYDLGKEDFAEASKYRGGDVWGAPTWGDAAYSAVEGILQSAPQSALTMGLLAVPAVGPALSVGTSGFLTAGQHMQRQAEEQKISLRDTSGIKAAITAAPSAVLDTLGAAAIMRGIPKNIVSSYVGQMVGRAAATGAGRIATASATEGVTETLQQAIEIVQANPAKLYEFSPETQKELLNAATIGGLFGGVAHTAMGPVESYVNSKRAAADNQLREDINRDAEAGRAEARRAEIESGVQAMIDAQADGPVNIAALRIAQDETNPDSPQIDVTRLYSKGKPLVDFSEPSVAEEAINEYKARTNANITLSTGAVDDFFGDGPNVTVKEDAVPFSDPKSRVAERIRERETEAPFKGGLSGTIKQGPNADLAVPIGNQFMPLDQVKSQYETLTQDQGVRTKIMNTPERLEATSMRVGLPAEDLKVELKDANKEAAPLIKEMKPAYQEASSRIPQNTITMGVEDSLRPGAAIWSNADNDVPVQITADPAERSDNGELYRKIVDDQGNSTYVPEAQLKMAPPKPAPISIKPTPTTPAVGETKKFPKRNGISYEALNKFTPGNKFAPLTPEQLSLIGGVSTSYELAPQPGTMQGTATEGEANLDTNPALADMQTTEWSGVNELPAPARTDGDLSTTVNIPGQPAPTVTAAYKARADKMAEVLGNSVRERLKGLGTPDFATTLASVITGKGRPNALRDGQTPRGLASLRQTPYGSEVVIELATGIYDPNLTVEQMTDKVIGMLNHEVIHGLYSAGLLNPGERRILAKAARDTKFNGRKYSFYDRAAQTYQPLYAAEVAAGRMTPEEVNAIVEEEAVAEMFREWAKNPTAAPVQARGLLNRILQFFKRLFSGFKSAQSHEIFRQIESGEVGARQRDYSESAAGPRLSIAPTAVEDEEGYSVPSEPAGIQNGSGMAVRSFPDVNTGSSSVYLRRNYLPMKAKGKINLLELGKAFDRAFLERMGRQFEITNQQDYDHIVQSMAEEVSYQMQQAQSGVGWYDGDIEEVFKELGKTFPILLDKYEGPVYRRLFTLIAGVMSNGMKAKANVEYAAMNFAHFLNTGRFSSTNPFTGIGWNQRSNIMGPQIAMLNSMVSDPRFAPRPGSNNPAMERTENFLRFMFSEHSVRDINQFRAKHGTKSPAKIGKLDERRLGAYAFGPKFGPFILNLNGISDETVDSWASRSFYRHMGRSVNPSGKMNDAPLGPAHREAMKRALRDISDKTKLSSRDIQAVLWFYEKELHNQLGQRVPLEVFSDGAKEFNRRYGTRSSRPDEFRTGREREIAGQARSAGTRYSAPLERRAGQKVRFAIAPKADPAERIDAFKDSQWARYLAGPRVDEALKAISQPGNQSTMVVMTPDEFIRMATYGLRNPGQESVYSENIARGMKLDEIPMLTITSYPDGSTIVTGHEGRHRSVAFKQLGITKMPVILKHNKYQWGLKKGNAPGEMLVGQPPMEHEMAMPDSVIFPRSEKGTSDLNEMLNQGAKLTSVSVGLAPAESSLHENAQAAMKENPPPYASNRKLTKAEIKEETPKYVPQGIAYATKGVETAARDAGAVNVYNTSGVGVYGGAAIEPTSTLEAIAPDDKAYAVANAMAAETFKVAKAHDQWDAFVAVKVPQSEWAQPYARPGITMYFYPRSDGPTARTLDEVKAIINSLPGADAIGGYTAIASKRATNGRQGIEAGYEAIRFIWVPEYAGVTTDNMIENYLATVKAMNSIAQYAKDNRIASASIDYYDLSLGSKANYDEKIADHGKLGSGRNAAGTGKSGPWRRPVSTSLAERAGQKTKRGADYSLDVQGTRKRFALSPAHPEAPSTPYVEAQRDTVYRTDVNESLATRINKYFFGEGYQPGNLASALKIHLFDTYDRIRQLEGSDIKAEYSSFVDFHMAERASHFAAAAASSGNLVVDTVAGDPRSMTVRVAENDDNIQNIFDLLQNGPVGPDGKKQVLTNKFFDYAIAQRATRLEADGKETPVDARWRREALAEGARHPEILEAYAMYQRYNRRLMETAHKAGAITDDEFHRFTKDMDYFSFYREYGDRSLIPGVGKKPANDWGIVPYKGSKLGNLVNDPLVMMIHNTNFWTGAIMKTIAARKAFLNLQDIGEAVQLAPNAMPDVNAGWQPEVMYYKSGGETYRFAVKDYLLTKALGSSTDFNAPKWLALFGLSTKTLREAITRDPVFITRNLMRDTIATWGLTGENIVPVLDTLRGMKAALKNDASMKALVSRGITGGYDEAAKGAQGIANRIRHTSQSKDKITYITNPKEAAGAMWRLLGKASDASDAATRIAVYEKAMAEGATEYQAAWRALKIMNFSRHGAFGAIRYLTMMYPFINARLQGTDILLTGLNAAGRTAVGKARNEAESNLGKRVLFRGAIFAALSLALEALNSKDDEYNQLPDYRKDSNLLIPMGNGEYFAWPQPFEFGVLFSTIPRHLYHHWKGDGDLRKDVNLFTSQFASTFGLNPMPQLAAPAYEVYANKSTFTGQALISEGMARLDPSLQYTDKTSKLARMLGEIPLNYNDVSGQFEGFSPVMIDHLITGYGGPLASYLLAATDVLSADLGPQQIPYTSITQYPVIKGFLIDAKATSPQSVADAYELYSMVDQVNRTYSRLAASGDAEAAMQYAQENLGVIMYKKQITQMVDALNGLRAQRRMIERDKAMSSEEKVTALQELRDLEKQLTANIGELNAALR